MMLGVRRPRRKVDAKADPPPLPPPAASCLPLKAYSSSNVNLLPSCNLTQPFQDLWVVPQTWDTNSQPPKLPPRPPLKKSIASSPGLAANITAPKSSKIQILPKADQRPDRYFSKGDEKNKQSEIWYEDAAREMASNSLCDMISSKFSSVITSIDSEEFSGDTQELEIRDHALSGLRGGWGTSSREVARKADRAISSAVISTNHFSKVHLYANSRLPPNLPPLQLYFPSYPLLCLAAQYSQRAYERPAVREREAFVDANWRGGTKTMVIKSVPIDDMNCVVFAIRGTQTFMDWAVNINSAPVAPADFLDDPGNLCHSGFLSVARNMIKPVAARLRALLEEDPSRSTCSLLMTGHSAGGAVASLLYAHMLAETTKSELNILTGCFKRIHCLTFGTPPISLLPLTKPPTLRYKKSLFLSFINEGDPVPRADKAYIRSLVNLYASPPPGTTCPLSKPLQLKPCKIKRPTPAKAHTAPTLPHSPPQFTWLVPPGTLSNAGRLVVLRDNRNASAEEPTNDVKAEITSDEQLRGVVFGDPILHMMKVYAKRVEVLATKAVTARIWG